MSGACTVLNIPINYKLNLNVIEILLKKILSKNKYKKTNQYYHNLNFFIPVDNLLVFSLYIQGFKGIRQ